MLGTILDTSERIRAGHSLKQPTAHKAFFSDVSTCRTGFLRETQLLRLYVYKHICTYKMTVINVTRVNPLTINPRK